MENVSASSLDCGEFTIEPHNEMGYSVRYPKIFIMNCIKKASRGSETAICDVRELLSKIDPYFVEKCERKKIRYWHFLPDNESEPEAYQTWQMQFQTNNRFEMEEYLQRNGYNYEWEGSGLFYWNGLCPFIFHPRSGERLWFNQVSSSHYTYLTGSPEFEGWQLSNKKRYPFHTTYGDGEYIEHSFIDEFRRITWESAVSFEWQDGDVLFLDQLVVQHSRLGYEGERKVGISLFTYCIKALLLRDAL